MVVVAHTNNARPAGDVAQSRCHNGAGTTYASVSRAGHVTRRDATVVASARGLRCVPQKTDRSQPKSSSSGRRVEALHGLVHGPRRVRGTCPRSAYYSTYTCAMTSTDTRRCSAALLMHRSAACVCVCVYSIIADGLQTIFSCTGRTQQQIDVGQAF